MSRGREDGQVSAFVVALVVPLVAVAGLVADGGGVLAAHQEAVWTAFEAARAGAQAVDIDALRTSGSVVLDQAMARSAALSYLSAAGYEGNVAVQGASVTVTVFRRHSLAVLSMLGIGPVTVVGTASATATQGISGPGS